MPPARSLHQALEAELAASPDDLATHAAYADLLSEEGDARGEFIQVQIFLEDPTLAPAERQRLQEREKQLLASYQERWLGPLAPFFHGQGVSFHFRRGWLHALDLPSISLPLARVLRDAHQARLLRELAIDSVTREEGSETHPDDSVPGNEGRPGGWPLVGSPNLANVRKFTFGKDVGDEQEDYHCTLFTMVVPELLRGMPRLEEAYLFATGYDLTDVFALPTLKNLRVLQVYHCSRVYRLDVLANNPALHHLTHLLCHPHALAWHDNRRQDEADGFRRDEGYLPLSVVRPLLAATDLSSVPRQGELFPELVAPPSPNLPRLTHLRLRVSSMGDEGCKEIVRSGVLKRLKLLDLRHGRITDQGARTLAECPDIRGLQMLDLGRNALSAEGVALIKALGVPCNVEKQHNEGSGANEEVYLHEGDIE